MKLTPSDLRRQAEALIADGRMPSLDELLTAVAEARTNYSTAILASRNEVVIRFDERDFSE